MKAMQNGIEKIVVINYNNCQLHSRFSMVDSDILLHISEASLIDRGCITATLLRRMDIIPNVESSLVFRILGSR